MRVSLCRLRMQLLLCVLTLIASFNSGIGLCSIRTRQQPQQPLEQPLHLQSIPQQQLQSFLPAIASLLDRPLSATSCPQCQLFPVFVSGAKLNSKSGGSAQSASVPSSAAASSSSASGTKAGPKKKKAASNRPSKSKKAPPKSKSIDEATVESIAKPQQSTDPQQSPAKQHDAAQHDDAESKQDDTDPSTSSPFPDVTQLSDTLREKFSWFGAKLHAVALDASQSAMSNAQTLYTNAAHKIQTLKEQHRQAKIKQELEQQQYQQRQLKEREARLASQPQSTDTVDSLNDDSSRKASDSASYSYLFPYSSAAASFSSARMREAASAAVDRIKLAMRKLKPKASEPQTSVDTSSPAIFEPELDEDDSDLDSYFELIDEEDKPHSTPQLLDPTIDELSMRQASKVTTDDVTLTPAQPVSAPFDHNTPSVLVAKPQRASLDSASVSAQASDAAAAATALLTSKASRAAIAAKRYFAKHKRRALRQAKDTQVNVMPAYEQLLFAVGLFVERLPKPSDTRSLLDTQGSLHLKMRLSPSLHHNISLLLRAADERDAEELQELWQQLTQSIHVTSESTNDSSNSFFADSSSLYKASLASTWSLLGVLCKIRDLIQAIALRFGLPLVSTSTLFSCFTALIFLLSSWISYKFARFRSHTPMPAASRAHRRTHTDPLSELSPHASAGHAPASLTHSRAHSRTHRFDVPDAAEHTPHRASFASIALLCLLVLFAFGYLHEYNLAMTHRLAERQFAQHEGPPKHCALHLNEDSSMLTQLHILAYKARNLLTHSSKDAQCVDYITRLESTTQPNALAVLVTLLSKSVTLPLSIVSDALGRSLQSFLTNFSYFEQSYLLLFLSVMSLGGLAICLSLGQTFCMDLLCQCPGGYRRRVQQSAKRRKELAALKAARYSVSDGGSESELDALEHDSELRHTAALLASESRRRRALRRQLAASRQLSVSAPQPQIVFIKSQSDDGTAFGSAAQVLSHRKRSNQRRNDSKDERIQFAPFNIHSESSDSYTDDDRRSQPQLQPRQAAKSSQLNSTSRHNDLSDSELSPDQSAAGAAPRRRRDQDSRVRESNSQSTRSRSGSTSTVHHRNSKRSQPASGTHQAPNQSVDQPQSKHREARDQEPLQLSRQRAESASISHAKATLPSADAIALDLRAHRNSAASLNQAQQTFDQPIHSSVDAFGLPLPATSASLQPSDPGRSTSRAIDELHTDAAQREDCDNCNPAADRGLSTPRRSHAQVEACLAQLSLSPVQIHSA